MTTSASTSGVTLVLATGATWNVPDGLSWDETPDITGTLTVTVYGEQPESGDPPKLASCSGVEIVYAGGSASPAAPVTAAARGL